jgi:hypothetical protein
LCIISRGDEQFPEGLNSLETLRIVKCHILSGPIRVRAMTVVKTLELSGLPELQDLPDP